jgi:hypothetical protein
VLPLPYHSASLPKLRGGKANAAKGKIKNCKTKAILKKKREKKNLVQLASRREIIPFFLGLSEIC